MRVYVAIKGEIGWEIERRLRRAGEFITPYPNDAELLIFDNEELAKIYRRNDNVITVLDKEAIRGVS